MTFEAFDVVFVPFPFTDQRTSKRRPALVLSRAHRFGNRAGHSVLAMITSQGQSPWPLDAAISDGKSAGLSSPSTVRMKLFTLDHRLILRKAERLEHRDRQNVIRSLESLLGWEKKSSAPICRHVPSLTIDHIPRFPADLASAWLPAVSRLAALACRNRRFTQCLHGAARHEQRAGKVKWP